MYIYNASGRKLLKKVIKNNTQISKTDYSGDYIYQGDQLQMIMTPENPTTHVAVILQEDHFDPYGMKLGGLSTATNDPTNKYLYQGKEFQDEGVDYNNDNNIDIYLNWYDFDARFFDVQLACWHVPDPAGQCASPYAAMGNNPVSMVDPSGMAYVWSLAIYYTERIFRIIPVLNILIVATWDP